ncbi:MAG: FKBP-type peptidyl-prolyl cis-trans isomerase [Algibacter sp.]|uniref:FKBP-type peptidyl-prolyl cis-trans isomerase n=1 Tax=Algibacter sp. TaxID=1872428 RepID=UPI003297EA29
MSLRKIGFFILSFVLIFSSCKKDDDNDTVVTIEINDRTEQQIVDDSLLVDYLGRHYYNSSAFGDSNTNPSIADLNITELLDGESVPDGNTLLGSLLDVPESALITKTINYLETEYKIYILKLNQGGGDDSPNFSDTVRVSYEGFTLDGNVFDSATTPVDFDLTSLIPAWSKVIVDFNVAEGFTDGDDGVVNFSNRGVGVMFLPSGLGYFSGATTDISSYSPLVFKFDLLQSFENDHDFDGIPSYLEDLFKEDGTAGSDGEYTVNYDDLTDETDDDTDGDGFPNYSDSDDDGDGVLTRDELQSNTYVVDTNNGGVEPTLDSTLEFEVSRAEVDGVITIKTLKIVDYNGDSIGDYLDADIIEVNNTDDY